MANKQWIYLDQVVMEDNSVGQAEMSAWKFNFSTDLALLNIPSEFAKHIKFLSKILILYELIW